MSTRSGKTYHPLAEKEFTLEDLPLELLYEIVGLLGRKDLISMTRVSRKLQEISRDPRFWKKIWIDVAKDSVNYVKLISGHCPLLQELSFCSKLVFDGKDWKEKSLELIRHFSNCEILEKLDLGNLVVGDEMTEFIAISFPRLKELRINDGTGIHLDLDGLTHLTKLESLDKLYLLGDSNFYYENAISSLKFIAENFKNVEEFGLQIRLDSNTFPTANDAFIRVLESHGDKLKKLVLEAISPSTLAYKKLAECKYLEDLDILYSDNLHDPHLAILQDLGNLRKLKLDAICFDVSWGGWIKFFNESASLLQLESLELSGTSLCDVGLTVIARNCPNLRHLILSENAFFSKHYFAIVLENFKQLESLEFGDFETNISSQELLQIPNKLPKLRKLRFCCFKGLEKVPVTTVNRLKELAPLLEVELVEDYL